MRISDWCSDVCSSDLILHAQEEAPMEATVAERGQITLPKAVRDALGLSKGTILKVELDGGRIILRKSVDDAISRARGRFKLDGFADTSEAMTTIRRSEEHTSELQSLMRISYAVFCLKKKKTIRYKTI